MNSLNLKHLSAAVISLAIAVTTLSAQTAAGSLAEANVDVTLQVVIASNERDGKAALPSPLVPAVEPLRSAFGFSSYRLAATFFERVANTGNIEYKGMTSPLGTSQPAEQPVFSDWSLGGLNILPGQVGNVMQFQHFRFGARVPLKVDSKRDESGETVPIYQYEQTGLTIQKLGVPENVPTVVGTLALPRTDEAVYLVLTVKRSDR